MLAIPPLAWATLFLALSLALTAGFCALVRKWVDRIGEGRPDPHELLTNFRELHARGGLSDVEFRTIKTKLAPELGAEEALGAASRAGERLPGVVASDRDGAPPVTEK